jgi:N-acetylneuraminic acid mutarotase
MVDLIININDHLNGFLQGFINDWDGRDETVIEGQSVPIDAAMAMAVDAISDREFDKLFSGLEEAQMTEKQFDSIKKQFYDRVMSTLYPGENTPTLSPN